MHIQEGIRLVEELYKASPNFQRSINIKYDLLSEEYIDFFVPTPHSVQALEEISSACLLNQSQRAHIFVGPYGVGKSILAVVMAALLARQNKNLPALERLLNRIYGSYPEISQNIISLYNQRKNFLPVVLSGDEGQLGNVIIRALIQSLNLFELTDVNPPTMYNAVIEKINQWKVNYKEVFSKFVNILESELNLTVGQFKDKIIRLDAKAYNDFCNIHLNLAAGAEFDYAFSQSPILLLEQVGKEIKKYGYDGIIIIYDEFGRYLESRIGKPKSIEAQLLQELAEFCSRSSDPIVHFVAITHKVMTQYSQGLNEEVRVEWQRIEGRFKTLSLSGDIRVSYRLLSEALRYVNNLYKSQVPSIASEMDAINGKAIELNIFDLSPNEALDILEKCIPLHPMTTYCLPELSNKVAQYERTLYTFLFGRDENSLGYIFESGQHPWPIIYIDNLYDYFRDAIKNDNTPGGAHDLWVAAEGTLSRLSFSHIIPRRIAKALAIIHIVKKGFSNRPNNDLLSFSLGYDANSKEFSDALQILVDSKMIYYRGSTECWEFVERSELNIDEEIDKVLSSVKPTRIDLKSFMEKELKTIYYPARKYNDKHGTTRFFTGRFYTIEELLAIDWDNEIRKNFIDGIVVYALVSNQEEAEKANRVILEKCNAQVIYVLPESYISIYEPLAELYALNILKERIDSLKEKDPRVEQEVNFLYEDSLEKIKKITLHLTDPSSDGIWYYCGKTIDINNFSSVCRFISGICEKVFFRTPIIFNEALNRSEPSGQQIKAMQKLIDALFQDHLPHNLGLIGSGPEMAVFKTVLKANGFVKEYDSGIEIIKPTNENLREVWDEIETFILSCSGEGLPLDSLVSTLRLPPYGIRKGILPVLLGLALTRFLGKISIEYQGRVLTEITSKHIVDIFNYPTKYRIKLLELNEVNKKIVEDTLVAVGFKDINIWKNSQPLSKASYLLNNWLLSLSTFTKNTKRMINEQAAILRQIIINSRMDPYKELLHGLPALVGENGKKSQNLVFFVAELTSADDRLLTGLVTESRKVFGNEEIEVNILAHTWFSNLCRRRNLPESFITSDNNSNLLIKHCNNLDLREHEWVKQIAQTYTGLDLRHWSDQTFDRFLQMLSASKEQIIKAAEEISGNIPDEVNIVSFGTKENQVSFTYHQTMLTPSGAKLLNSLKRTLDITGRYLTQDEKIELCMEILKYVVK
jgi:hypothetical protein